MKLGDPPSIEFRDACKSCGSIEGFKWHYGQNDGKSEGYSECKSCGAVRHCIHCGKEFCCVDEVILHIKSKHMVIGSG